MVRAAPGSGRARVSRAHRLGQLNLLHLRTHSLAHATARIIWYEHVSANRTACPSKSEVRAGEERASVDRPSRPDQIRLCSGTISDHPLCLSCQSVRKMPLLRSLAQKVIGDQIKNCARPGQAHVGNSLGAGTSAPALQVSSDFCRIHSSHLCSSAFLHLHLTTHFVRACTLCSLSPSTRRSAKSRTFP